jgi:large subunit ribosomal protein L18e
MARSPRKQNPELTHAVHELRRAARENAAPIWSAAADRLERARHQTTPVNVGHLDRLASAKETIIVPGKLLADGEIHQPLTVAAFSWSEGARTKVHAAGGQLVTIHDLLKSRPDGAGVRLLG